MIDAWEDPATEGFLRSAILTAAHEPIALERLAANFAIHILDAVSSRLSDQERFVRASLASSQLVGLAMTRYIWKVGALAGLPPTRVIDLIAPTIQRYLTGELA
jgi:Tetracyclin repressor-like, C-terminal domain